MDKKIEIRGNIHKNLKYIELDGKTYVVDENKQKGDDRNKQHQQTTIKFKEFNIKEYESLVDTAAEKISTKANVKEIIKQSLLDLPLSDLIQIKKELEKPKPFIRNNLGCVSMNIGKIKLQIRN